MDQTIDKSSTLKILLLFLNADLKHNKNLTEFGPDVSDSKGDITSHRIIIHLLMKCYKTLYRVIVEENKMEN